MIQHYFNLYPVTNLNQIHIQYRLVDVEGELGLGSDDPDLAVKNLNLLAKKVAFGQRLPIAILQGGERPLLAVGADRDIQKCQLQLTPHVVTLHPRDEIHTLDLRSGDDSKFGIILSFLGWQLRGHLNGHNNLWRSGAATFYRKQPVNDNEGGRRIDIYGGFSPRFLFIEGQLHVSVPVVYCYTDSRWADVAFGDRELQRLGGRKMLYHYGDRRFPIKFQRRTGHTVSSQEFSTESSAVVSNVYDWTMKNAGGEPNGRVLDPNSAAIRYKNLGNDEERFGALSLCKLMLNNDDDRVASSRREHQRTPDERIDASSGIVKRFLGGIKLAGVTLDIATTPRSRQAKHFKYPALQFGNGTILKVGEDRRAGEVALRDLPNARANVLEQRDVGFAVVSDLVDQVIVAPRSLAMTVVNDLKGRFEGAVSKLLRQHSAFQVVRYGDEGKTTLNAQVSSVVHSLRESGVNGARGILILPRRAQPDLHNYIKRKLRDTVQFQCMATEKLDRFYGSGAGSNMRPPNDNRFQSYLKNTVQGLMLVNRQWPWVLHEGTHYDAYIGLDVLNHTAAMTFFYEGGRVCSMRDQESSDKERLSRRVVCKLVYESLKQDLPDLDQQPRSIILRRDGRLHESEWQGFSEAIQKLVAEGVLPDGIVFGALEIPKHHAFGIRLIEKGNRSLINPSVGAWEQMSETEGLVCTTGWPFNIPGTVEPLFVKVVRGDLDIREALEDTFRMSQLSWPVPRNCMRLPIDLKLCDEHLRAFASIADEDLAVFGEPTESDEEPLAAVR